MKDKLIDRIIQKLYAWAIDAGIWIILLGGVALTIGLAAWIMIKLGN